MRKVKLSWEDQIKIKQKKEEDKIKLNQTEQRQSVEAKVHQKISSHESKFIDDYDLYIIGKALSNLKLEIEKKSWETKKASEKEEMELEFHEQYFS